MIAADRIEYLRREHDGRAWMAWHIAQLSRAKKIPKLKTLFAPRRERKPQTWQEQLAIAQRWASVLNAKGKT